MKLRRFTKNKKQKQMISGAIIAIVLVIGGITLYRSFAFYEEHASFNVLKGRVPEFYNDVTFALVVDGKTAEEIPKKSDNYAVEVKCDKGNGIWKQDIWGVEVTELEEKTIKCNIEFITLEENKVINFDYTGKEEIISLPKGKYRLEVWGAQGATKGANQTEKEQQGGLGGYSVGEYTTNEGKLLYINVGGKGSEHKDSNGNALAGYNGGGTGSTPELLHGGGATHIALVSGLLSTLKEKNNDILIVAGGGGANGEKGINSDTNKYPFGGSGGGAQGGDGINSDKGWPTRFYGTGATQESGGNNTDNTSYGKGDFGLGSDFYNNGYSGAGGGGGYYGGGGSNRNHAGAGGGSGYIGNSLLTSKEMWCYNCKTNEDENSKTKSTTNVSNEAKSQYAKQGDGYAKITYLGNIN